MIISQTDTQKMDETDVYVEVQADEITRVKVAPANETVIYHRLPTDVDVDSVNVMVFSLLGGPSFLRVLYKCKFIDLLEITSSMFPEYKNSIVEDNQHIASNCSNIVYTSRIDLQVGQKLCEYTCTYLDRPVLIIRVTGIVSSTV